MTSEPLGPRVIHSLTGPQESTGAWSMAQKKVFKVPLESHLVSFIRGLPVHPQVAWLPGWREGMGQSLRCVK